MTWTTIVVIICLLLAVFSVWKEHRRENRLRLVWRIIGCLIAVIALACIALPVSYTAKTITGSKEGVLLTKGYQADSLAAYQNSKLFTTDYHIQKANPKLPITLVANLGDFPKGKYNISLLQVLGYGLDQDELAGLQNFPLKFHPAALTSGITAISWNSHLKTGDQLHVQGKFDNASAKKISLILKGLNTGLDSVVISGKGTTNFDLKYTPKNTGRAVYNLLALAGNDTLEKEDIPFETEPGKTLKVLMLASAPDFENKFLKDWLSKNGYGLAIRTSISKDKYSREYFNMPQTPTDHITPQLLEKFDVLIGDLSTFKALSASETGSIKDQLAQKGLGIIVKADSSKGTSYLSAPFPLARLPVKEQKPLPLLIEGKTTPSAKLPLDAVAIQYQNNTQPLVYDDQNHVLASSTIYGSGKMVFTLLNNTFNWALSGSADDYTSLWSLLIGKAARKTNAAENWGTLPAFPLVDRPAELILEGPVAAPPKVNAGTSVIAFAQNPGIPFKWSGTFWPKTAGWQQVNHNNGHLFWWYVYDYDDWNTLSARRKSAETMEYINKSNSANKVVPLSEENFKQIPVSKLYFYLLLLFSCIFLWVERKIAG